MHVAKLTLNARSRISGLRHFAIVHGGKHLIENTCVYFRSRIISSSENQRIATLASKKSYAQARCDTWQESISDARFNTVKSQNRSQDVLGLSCSTGQGPASPRKVTPLKIISQSPDCKLWRHGHVDVCDGKYSLNRFDGIFSTMLLKWFESSMTPPAFSPTVRLCKILVAV